MKNKLIKLTIATALFVCGAGYAANQSASITPVEAAFQDNFDPFTYQGNYYNNLDTSGTNGIAGSFKTTLANFVKPSGWYTYGGSGSDHLSTILQSADEDPNNSQNMIYLYTRDSVKKNAASTWNREHVWPQSLSNGHWGTDYGGTDILHIRPTYDTTNNRRGNEVYGDVNKQGQLIYGGVVYGYSSNGYFEPLDCIKGDIARIIMYVHTVYSIYYNDANLLPTKTIRNYDTLLKWHMQDKPDISEGNRNDFSEGSRQKNRNPFVDHPEYAWRVFEGCASSAIEEQCKTTYPADGSGTQGKSLTGISISGQANKKTYVEGQSFDPTGLTINATYDDNSTGTINPNSCTWEPAKLTIGTTSVTCKYGRFSAVYSGITVTERVVSDTEFSVKFKASGEDSGDVLTNATALALCEENTLISEFTAFTKAFPGQSGIKLGSSSVNGSISFKLKTDAQTKIAAFKLQTAQYKTNASTIEVKFDNTVIANDITGGQDYTKPLDEVNCTTVTISSTGRCYLVAISIEIKKADVPPSGSSNPTSSNVPTTSNTTSTPVTTSTPGTTSTPEASSNGNGSSTSNNVEPRKGCNGSIVAISAVTGLSALVGIVLVFSKKKEK